MVLRNCSVLRNVVRSEGGAVAIQMGILLTVLIGMVALETEIPFVLYKHRQIQSAVDAVAFGSAVALRRGYPSNPNVEGQGIAAALGFGNNDNGVIVTINNPPATGAHAGNASAIEAIIAQPQTLTLVGLFIPNPFHLSARAVALAGSGGSYCVLATDTNSATAVTLSNGANVSMNSCGLAVNANGPAALSVTGGSVLNAQSVLVSSQDSVTNGGSINAVNGVKFNQANTADPYANVPTPAQSGCSYTNRSLQWSSSVQQLTPGTYCNGLSISNGASVSMAPGVYYIKSGTFSIAGGSTLTGSGVTIVLTNNTSGYATASISNGSSVSLSAPNTGVTAGIVFFSDRNAPTSGTINFSGGTSEVFAGALYFPTQQVLYSNGASAAACTQLIAWHIQFTGGSQFNSNCAGIGTSSIGTSAASQLAE